MKSSSASRMNRPKMWFAIVAVSLLLIGMGTGYFIGNQPPTPGLGPVNSLVRPSTIPRVAGWYKGAEVSYLDYAQNPNVVAPILAFFHADAPNTPAAGQRNIIDTIPGLPGYSDFWRVHKVLVPSSYVANSIRSFEEAVVSGYPIEVTDLVVNCPVVNSNVTIQGSSAMSTKGWYRDRDVFYFDHGANTSAQGYVIQDAPIYAFFHADDTAVAGQRNVINVRPGDVGYSDLWRVVKVIVDQTYVANSLTEASAIMAAASAGKLSLESTSIYVNCPVVP